ncbi:MAG: hypothetical protein GY765_18080 [bacterium]|nr:hypothetical protein [bacterium]
MDTGTLKENTPTEILMDDLDDLLDRIFVSGIYALSKDISHEINGLSTRCEQLGMDTAVKLLTDLHDTVERKRHDFQDNVSEICRLTARLGLYIKELRNSYDAAQYGDLKESKNAK